MLEKEFQGWLDIGGARVYDIEPAIFPGELRGVKATKPIEPVPAGDLLVTVPERLLISTSSARLSPDFAYRLEAADPLTDLQILAAFLIYELSKGTRSFWAPYLRTLPRSYTSLSYFSAREAEQLQVEYAKAAAAAARQEVEDHCSAIKPLLAALGVGQKCRSLSAVKWALATLNSRTMFLEGHPAGVLMPFGDLHNHSPPPGPQVPDLGIALDKDGRLREELQVQGDGCFDTGAGLYRLHARCRYEPGQQVFLCYGAHSNLDLLEHYGFVLETNPHDAALLPVEALRHSQLREAVQPRDSWLHPCGVPSWELLKALRLWAAAQCGQWKNRQAAIEGRRICENSELLAMSALKDTCLGVLESLPDTHGRDQEMLKGLRDGEEKPNERVLLAIRWRYLHRTSLLNAMNVAEKVISRCSE